MQKDIREELKDYKEPNVELSANHQNKFEKLLMAELHQQQPKKKSFKWLSIAASIVLLISLGIKFYPKENPKLVEKPAKDISLGSISPEFETIEKYYKNSINLEISQLELTEDNKEIIDGYLSKIRELTKEYKSLTKELSTKGVNDSTIEALISNLQLRLQLLQRLKKQLKELKNLNKTQNETQII
ncbi:hypothetical protein FDT66_01300 [Polaribacter aestuariivivens]|uniref:DUF4179 domain-containing protein n=1 Tax=Polaribacter aestuariivivens TaxID=2304626 RepID=A0A5S3NA26_9FLAO|nr:hypothetical protein [Polaribacter aestuariivivens]TMM32130.1 hypothetical protein FDT66_01300 [Polaribacter aestuariivivens]